MRFGRISLNTVPWVQFLSITTAVKLKRQLPAPHAFNLLWWYRERMIAIDIHYQKGGKRDIQRSHYLLKLWNKTVLLECWKFLDSVQGLGRSYSKPLVPNSLSHPSFFMKGRTYLQLNNFLSLLLAGKLLVDEWPLFILFCLCPF
jgi:hypothetical protein